MSCNDILIPQNRTKCIDYYTSHSIGALSVKHPHLFAESNDWPDQKYSKGK